jgi:osmoprotectant transport system permease protein
MALLGVLVLVEGLGFWTAVTALAAYAQMILVRNIAAGISGVDRSVIEAAVGSGMSPWQVLWRVERPLAMPVVIAGVRIATVSIIGIASVAAWVGAGGLGTLIFAGIDQGNYAKAVTGAIAAMALALIADGLLRLVERRYRIAS